MIGGIQMKSILVIGIGRFGRHLARKLIDLGNQVMIVDIEEKKMSDIIPILMYVLYA